MYQKIPKYRYSPELNDIVKHFGNGTELYYMASYGSGEAREGLVRDNAPELRRRHSTLDCICSSRYLIIDSAFESLFSAENNPDTTPHTVNVRRPHLLPTRETKNYVQHGLAMLATTTSSQAV